MDEEEKAVMERIILFLFLLIFARRYIAVSSTIRMSILTYINPAVQWPGSDLEQEIERIGTDCIDEKEECGGKYMYLYTSFKILLIYTENFYSSPSINI